METSEFKEQLRSELSKDFEGLVEQVAQSVLQAKAGRVIVDSEELVRDAVAEFRQRVYQKALELRMRTERSAFSPPAVAVGEKAWRNKGRQKVTHLTINGRVDVERVVYWRKDRGPMVPTDALLGIGSSRYSPGIRERTCRIIIPFGSM